MFIVFYNAVIIPSGKPHILKTESSLMRLCFYHVDATVSVPSGKPHILKTESSLMRLYGFQVDDAVVTSSGLPHILQAHYFCCIALVAVNLA